MSKENRIEEKEKSRLKSIDVYKQYFSAFCDFDGDVRRGASVVLNATSEEGNVEYKVCVSFFLHEDEDDFRISYDRYFEKVLFSGKGRRTRKRDAEYMKEIRAAADAIAGENRAVIDWEKPLNDAMTDAMTDTL